MYSHLWWLLLDLFLACGSIRQEVLYKKGVLRNFAKFTGKHKKGKKETPAQVFSCEFCNTYKNSFSYRIPPVAASVHVIPYSLPILLHPFATSNRHLPLHFPMGKIIEKEYSKLTSTWYIHCFKSCYSNFL